MVAVIVQAMASVATISTLNVRGPSYLGLTWSISWLLMLCLLCLWSFVSWSLFSCDSCVSSGPISKTYFHLSSDLIFLNNVTAGNHIATNFCHAITTLEPYAKPVMIAWHNLIKRQNKQKTRHHISASNSSPCHVLPHLSSGGDTRYMEVDSLRNPTCQRND